MRDLLDIAGKQSPLPTLNTADTDHDFAVFISSKPCGDKVAELAKRVKDPRVLFWTPDDLNPSEQDRLLDFAAYRELVGEYNNKDSQDAKDVMNWVADRLRNEIGSIYKIVPDSYARGRIAAADHGHLTFTCEGELPAILEPLVGQVLDATYASATIDFSAAPAPFDDAEAIKVINGIVRTGEIPKNTKPTKDTSAADNYGYALGIMKKTGVKKLDTAGCVFVEDVEEWIEAQIGEGGGTIPVPSLYKNFTGINGPNGKNYGLSRRMIDVYLLSLVRQGKLRVTLSGKAAATAEYLDYSNLEEITFNAALLNGMAKVQRLKAPEGWAVLAPYAAVLLGDETVKTVQQDAEINGAVKKLLEFHAEQKTAVATLAGRLDDLFADIRLANPVAETMADWKAFFAAEIDRSEPIAHLRHALDNAFGYKAYEENEAKQSEVDDLATRKRTWERAAAFAGHDREVRAASRYAKLQVSPTGVLGELAGKVKALGKTLASLDDLMESEAKLQAQLLDPLAEIQETYRTRYLQAYDNVTGQCEAVRSEIDALARSPEMKALEALATIDALGKIEVPRLKAEAACCKDRLFQTEVRPQRRGAGLAGPAGPRRVCPPGGPGRRVDPGGEGGRGAGPFAGPCGTRLGGRAPATAGALVAAGAGSQGAVHRRGPGDDGRRVARRPAGRAAARRPRAGGPAGEVPQAGRRQGGPLPGLQAGEVHGRAGRRRGGRGRLPAVLAGCVRERRQGSVGDRRSATLRMVKMLSLDKNLGSLSDGKAKPSCCQR